jgi:predicted 2-oxoglutarate/Fe(II)-dependent dioxygenase YbiX
MRKEFLWGEDVFVVPEFYSSEECDASITRAESLGFDEAPITTMAGPVMAKEIRDNTRVMHDDFDLARDVYARILPFLPQKIGGRKPKELNERWRWYRYEPGERFKPHYDGTFQRNALEWSELTLMIYLNDDFAGGETKFYQRTGELRVSVTPVKGTALVFVHRKLHEGAIVLRGKKYVLRTDVMYTSAED